jgi:regulator of PEP synthase PpsR (kinase-PPPase family)
MTTPKIFIVSGGNGASGELVVHTVLAQFPGIDIAVQTFPWSCTPSSIPASAARWSA